MVGPIPGVRAGGNRAQHPTWEVRPQAVSCRLVVTWAGAPGMGSVLTTLGFCCASNMPTGGCEVQAEQPADPPVHPVRFKPLLGSTTRTFRGPQPLPKKHGQFLE